MCLLWLAQWEINYDVEGKTYMCENDRQYTIKATVWELSNQEGQ